jgi:hypothetical protein
MNATIQHRLVTCLQQRGNLGKSTALALFAQFLEQHSVPWQGFDLDGDHRSFSRLFPATVSLVSLGTEPENDIINLARRASESAVTVIDPRAHLSDTIMRAWDIIHFPELFAESGGRITTLLFPADDLEILTDLDSVVTRLGKTVDYIIVRNPARQARTRMFDGSELESDLLKLGAAELEIPPLLGIARNHLAALEANLDRGVTHVEAVANQELTLDGMARLIIRDWLERMFSRIRPISDHIAPPGLVSKQASPDKVKRPASHVVRGAKINRNNL